MSVPDCHDCAVRAGHPHLDGCDVARCVVTGAQRFSCGGDHDCGHDYWTGEWYWITEPERTR